MYTARVIGKTDDGFGRLRMGVFDGNGNQLGEYTRNYASFGEATFCPFQAKSGRWYALYSSHYTCTRVMSLPDCKDIGGEEPHQHGFCPVDYYVPILCGQEYEPNDKGPVVANHQPDVWAHKVPYEGGVRYYWPDDDNHPEPNEERKSAYLKAKEESRKEADVWYDGHPYVERYAPFGFVAGCIWGDDFSWKLQFLDLSKAEGGVLSRDDRFGYVEVNTPLKDNVCVNDPDNLLDYTLDKLMVSIYQKTVYTMRGSKRK